MRINLILLAAGNSRRFGSNKLLYIIDGKPMYQYVTDTIDSLPEGLFSKKIIVTQYEELLSDDWLNNHYTVVNNPDSQRGISSSIQIGLAHSEDAADAWCFMVCDQPQITGKTIEEFVLKWKQSEQPLGCVIHEKHLGNPAIFAKVFRQELFNLTGDTGGKGIIKNNSRNAYYYEVENQIELDDIDIVPKNL